MQFIATADNFSRAIKAVSEVAQKDSPQETFNHILIHGETGTLYAEACCGVSSAYSEIECEEHDVKAGFYCRGEDIQNIAKYAKEDVSVSADMKSEVATFTSGSYTWRIPCKPGGEFLKFKCSAETPKGATVTANWMKAALQSSKLLLDDPTGVVAQVGVRDGKIIFGASSRTRTVYFTEDADHTDADLEAWISLPSQAVKQAIAFVNEWSGDIEVSADSKAAYLTAGKSRFAFHPLNDGLGLLAKASQFKPTDVGLKIVANVKDVDKAIRSVTVGATTTKRLKVWCGQGCGLIFTQGGRSANRSSIENSDPSEGTVWVDYSYLQDAIKAASHTGEETVRLMASNDILFMSCGNARAVIAGMREESGNDS